VRVAIFPGTFDPPTLGHIDVVTRACAVFDRVVVAILKNPAKKPLFTLEERATMLREACQPYSAVEVDMFDGLLTDYAATRGACAIVRGIRNTVDFDYELQMAGMNRHLAPAIDTVFLATSTLYAHISSSLVRDIVTFGGSLQGLVPSSVEAAVAERRTTQRTQRV
jgi:pantetheine-phosphate adenylyltransferase